MTSAHLACIADAQLNHACIWCMPPCNGNVGWYIGGHRWDENWTNRFHMIWKLNQYKGKQLKIDLWWKLYPCQEIINFPEKIWIPSILVHIKLVSKQAYVTYLLMNVDIYRQGHISHWAQVPTFSKLTASKLNDYLNIFFMFCQIWCKICFCNSP